MEEVCSLGRKAYPIILEAMDTFSRMLVAVMRTLSSSRSMDTCSKVSGSSVLERLEKSYLTHSVRPSIWRIATCAICNVKDGKLFL